MFLTYVFQILALSTLLVYMDPLDCINGRIFKVS